MAYYVSYILNDDGKRAKGKSGVTMPAGLYHASIAITEHTVGKLPIIVAKVGLFNSSQIEIEDFLQPKDGRKFYHKTYPITDNEMVQLVQKINRDRKMGIFPAIPKNSKAPKHSPESVKHKHKRRAYENADGQKVVENVVESLESIPGGPEYSFFRLNCKTYAMSLLKSVGINDRDLQNWIVDDPGTGIEKMQPLTFHQTLTDKGERSTLVWDSPMKVSERLTEKQLRKLNKTESKNILKSIETNNFKAFLQDACLALKHVDEYESINVDELLNAFEALKAEISDFEKRLKNCLEMTHAFVKSNPDLQLKDIEEWLNPEDSKRFKAYQEKENLNSQSYGNTLLNFMDHRLKKLSYEAYDKWMGNSHKAIKAFEVQINTQNYNLKKYIVDALKNALNTLGAGFKISPEYKSKKMLKQFQEYSVKSTKIKQKINGLKKTSNPSIRPNS